MSSELRFLYRTVRTADTGSGGGKESFSLNATNEPPPSSGAEQTHEIKGVIFDMDGTLTMPFLDFLAIKKRIGLPPEADILPTVLRMSQKERERAMKIIEEHEGEASYRLQLQPGVLELMNFIAKHNVKRALVTRNSKKVAQVLLDKLSQQVTENEHLYPHLDPANIFSEIIARDFEPCKPDPACVFHICKQWSLEPASIAFVGDDRVDMKCCHRAGAGVGILLKNERNMKQENLSDYTVDSLLDIISLLKSILTVNRS